MTYSEMECWEFFKGSNLINLNKKNVSYIKSKYRYNSYITLLKPNVNII